MLVLPRGLLQGERLAKCSDEAQLHFPRLAALTNGFGRIELNLRSILESAYSGFNAQPTRAQLTGWLKEYAAAHLLFVYQAPDGKPWGQWRGIPDNMLPRFKTAADKRSPIPPLEELAKFDEEYSSLRKASGDFLNVASDFGNVPKSSEGFGNVLNISVDEVVDEGKQKQNLSSPLARESGADPLSEVPELEFALRQGADSMSPNALAKSVGLAVEDKPPAHSSEDREAVKRVFAYYLEKLGKSSKQYELTEKRMKKGLAALRACRKRFGDGPQAEEALGAAVDGLLANGWLMGANPQTKKYTDWETYVVKDTETMEKRWEDGGFKPDVYA